MNIDPETCYAQAKAFDEAAEASPLSIIARPLRLRAKEWRSAGDDLATAIEMGFETAEIVMAGALDPGCRVVSGSKEGDLIRVIDQGGRVSLHVQNVNDGRESYHNCWGGKTSPVVVL